MSSLDIRTTMEVDLLERAQRDLKDVLCIYFQSNRMKPKERILLGEYIKKGLFESTSKTLVFGSTRYGLSHDLILSEKTPYKIDEFKTWVEVLIAKLGLSHGLSKELDNGVIKPINDKVVECLNGKIKFLSEKLEDLNNILRENKTLTTSNVLLRGQISSLQVEVESLRESMELLKIKDAHIVENLTSTTRDQARAIKNTSEIQNMNALIGMLMKQYEAFATAFKQFQKNKDAAILVHDSFLDVGRNLESAKNTLADLVSDAWFTSKVDQALPVVSQKIESLALEFSEKRRAEESTPLRQSQAAICRHRVDEIIKKLSQYESSLNGQYFKTFRMGYKTKLPDMKKLIKNIESEQARIHDNGINSREIMVRIRDLITFEKERDGVETDNYKQGTGFKKLIDKALSLSGFALSGELASMERKAEESKQEQPSELDKFKDSVNEVVSDFLKGTAISGVIIEKATSAVSHLSSIEESHEALRESVETAVSVGDKFVKDLKSKLDGVEPEPLESVQEYVSNPGQVMACVRKLQMQFKRANTVQREGSFFPGTSLPMLESGPETDCDESKSDSATHDSLSLI